MTLFPRSILITSPFILKMPDLDDGLYGVPNDSLRDKLVWRKQFRLVVTKWSLILQLPASSGESGPEREADLARCEVCVEQKVKEDSWACPEKTGFSLSYSSPGDGKGKRKFTNVPTLLRPSEPAHQKNLAQWMSQALTNHSANTSSLGRS